MATTPGVTFKEISTIAPIFIGFDQGFVFEKEAFKIGGIEEKEFVHVGSQQKLEVGITCFDAFAQEVKD